MKKLKLIFAKLIRKICCISPEWGNRVMDILGYERYCKVIKLAFSDEEVIKEESEK